MKPLNYKFLNLQTINTVVKDLETMRAVDNIVFSLRYVLLLEAQHQLMGKLSTQSYKSL